MSHKHYEDSVIDNSIEIIEDNQFKETPENIIGIVTDLLTTGMQFALLPVWKVSV